MASLIYLDVDDEITSAATRIRALDAHRIGLVLPLGSRLATSRINFRLLAHEADARGKRLEIVTGDASARALAASAGLPTHVSAAAFEAEASVRAPGASVRAAARTSVPAPEDLASAAPVVRGPAATREVPSVGRRSGGGGLTGRSLAFLLALAVLLAGAGTAGFLLLPSAEVTLVPESQAIGDLHFSVTAQPGVTQPDPVNLLVPATTFRFDVEASSAFPATGVKIDETPATGAVTFSNLDTGGSNTIPAGSIVATQDGVQFRTTGGLTLPPAQLVFGSSSIELQPSTGTVGIEAVLPGPTGNVEAGTIRIVPPNENSVLTKVSNDAPTTGGTHTESPEVVQADVDAALVVLKGQLATAFDTKVAAATGVPPGTTLFLGTAALGDPTPSVDPASLVGSAAAEFQLGASATGTVIGVDPGPVATLAEARLRDGVGEGYSIVDSTIRTVIGTPIVAGATVSFPVTVSAIELRVVDEAALRAQMRGLGVPQARSLLGAYGEVTIRVWPDWVTTIPTNDGRLSFTVKPPELGASPVPGESGAPSAPGSAAP
jgi:hypothetical protein